MKEFSMLTGRSPSVMEALKDYLAVGSLLTKRQERFSMKTIAVELSDKQREEYSARLQEIEKKLSKYRKAVAALEAEGDLIAYRLS